MSTTVKAAVVIAAGQAAVAGVAPAKVAILTEGVLKAMLVTKLKSVMGFMLPVVATVGLGAGLLAYGTAAGENKDNEKAKAVAPQKDAAATSNREIQRQDVPKDDKDAAATSNREVHRQDVPKDDSEKLQGVWQIESMEGDGQKVSSDDLKNAPPEQTRVWIVGDKWITRDGQGGGQQQTFRLDPSKSPRAINIRAVDGTIDQLGIYRLEADQLTICMWGGDQPAKQERPKAFTTGKGSDNILIVYKRVAKKEAEKPDKSKDDNKYEPEQRKAKRGVDKADVVAPDKAVAKSDKDQLLGNWLVISCKCNGEDRPEEPWSKDALLVIEKADGKLVCKTVFKDKAKVIEVFGEDMEKYTEATLRVDARTKPKTLDLTQVNEHGTYLGIYKLDGDTLTLCISKSLTPEVAKTGKDRPTDFSTKSGDGRSLMVYKRQKETEPKSRDSSPVPAKKADAAKTDLDRLQGVWSVVSIEQGGKPSKLDTLVFMVDGKRACLQGSDGEMQGGLYLGPTAKPKSFDLAMSTRTIEGIYSLEGDDTLRLCYDPRGVEESKRPGGFLTEKGSPQILLVLKRTYGPEVFPFRLADGTRAFPTLIEKEGKTPPPPQTATTPKGGNLTPYKVADRTAKVGRIIIVGNTKTETSAILKMIPLHPGDVLDYDALLRAEENLAAFSPTITVEESGDRAGNNAYDRDCKDVRVTVKEK
jgi:uncharacterized protein (TIGR03067 family)